MSEKEKLLEIFPKIFETLNLWIEKQNH